MLKNRVKRCLVVFLSLCFAACCTVLCVHITKENKLNQIRQEALATLAEDLGTYDEKTIVLNDTNRSSAENLARKLDAELRITSDGGYATLTLRNGRTVLQVFRKKTQQTQL